MAGLVVRCANQGAHDDEPAIRVKCRTCIEWHMVKKAGGVPDTKKETTLRRFRAPWKGEFVLACGKCQKKVARDGGKGKPLKLKKALKRAAAREQARIRLLVVPCLKLCPKGAIAVCTQEQFGRGECSMVRSIAEVRVLVRECVLAAESRDAKRMDAVSLEVEF